MPYLLLLLLMLPGGVAVAVPPGPEEFGRQTRQWLELQRSQLQASRHQDRLAPEATAKAKQRMLESFGHAIPDRYIKSNFKE
ncbi:DUF3613 domain-containing protein [Zobellella sp. An-6]|uniref:DUF3613 domain-containing protein n=1 Tax=Zobellella sp. An-6 TaxID=3400218 RepID=UPI0040411B9D